MCFKRVRNLGPTSSSLVRGKRARVTWPWLYSDPCSIFPLPGSVPRTSSPYAQVPIFPLILNEDTKTLVKPKKNMQKLVRQRKKEPVASTQSCSIHERNHMQEVRDKHDASDTSNSTKGGLGTSLKTCVLFNQAATLKPPALSRKQKRSPTVSSAHPNRQRHPKTGNQGKTQAHTSVRSSPTPQLPSRSRPHSTPHSVRHSLHVFSPFSAAAFSHGLSYNLFFFPLAAITLMRRHKARSNT